MALWLAADPLVLASRSAARRAVLEAAGIALELQPADLDERKLEAEQASQSPAAAAAFLAQAKAEAVAAQRPGRLILGADQTLALGRGRLSKPADRAAARAQLLSLRGRSHELHSAIAFVEDGAVLFAHTATARLRMRAFSEAFVDRYLDQVGEQAQRSVGAYQIEGVGVQLFEEIDGDYFTILGLPLLPALEFLRQRGCLAS